MKIDLHIHTTASDGRLSPQEVVNQALEVGLTHIAITDHDTVNAILSLNLELNINAKPITIIPGIEFSTDLPDNEVHILGYNINILDHTLQQQLSLMTTDRWDRVRRTITKLAALGYHIEYERIVELAGQSTAVGRPHIARAIVEKGYFPSVTEVFNSLLYKNGPAYVPHFKLDYPSVIKLIHQAGGIAVLAHPGLIGNEAIVNDIIHAGIHGIEVYHPRHDDAQTKNYLQIAKEHQLLITGGSDFHGIPTRFPEKLGIFTPPPGLLADFLALVGMKD